MKTIRAEYVYISCWAILNIITASFTDLYADEAYYWLYGQFPDWGYFDHPPAVGLLIRAFSFLGHHELAVRIGSIGMMTAAVFVAYRLSNVSSHLFFISVFSIFSLNIIGFMALPDAPLIFFGVMFLWAYKQFLKSYSWSYTLLLSVLGALMLYSKYHGILIIGFTLLSNLRLLRKPQTYVIGILILLLFSPHLWWQYVHDFPSYSYHAIHRSADAYKPSFTTTYLLTNPLFHGPIFALVAGYFTFFHKGERDAWKRALRWNIAGTFLFFLLSSFKGNVEANWTIFIVFPLLMIGLDRLDQLPKWKNRYLVASSIAALMILAIRALLTFPLFDSVDRLSELKKTRAFAERVYALADGLPVAANRYQEASILSFYAPQQLQYVPALNMNSRLNQFEIWELDTALLGQKVLFLNHYTDFPDQHRIAGFESDSLYATVIDPLPRVTGYDLWCDSIEVKRRELTFKLHLDRPAKELPGNDKNRISIWVWDEEGKIRYSGQDIESTPKNVRIGVYEADQKVRIFLKSSGLRGDLKDSWTFDLHRPESLAHE